MRNQFDLTGWANLSNITNCRLSKAKDAFVNAFKSLAKGALTSSLTTTITDVNVFVDEYFNIKKVTTLLEEYTAAYGEATKETHRRYGKSWAADKYESEAANLRIYFLKRAETAKEYLDSFIENNK